jgi:peptidoglycan/xylan/chitin deacetylase (PgdA/CDA1 family)
VNGRLDVLAALGVLFCACFNASASDKAIGVGAKSCFPVEHLMARPFERTPRADSHGSKMAIPFGTGVDPARAAPIKGAIRRVALPVGSKLVALTFDLCEAGGEVAGYDGEIVDLLRKEAVQATFFAGGKWLATHPERAMQLLADPQFEIGNHTWSHADLAVVSGTAMKNQVIGPEISYAAARRDLTSMCPVNRSRERMNIFRFPYGSCSPESLAFVNERGYRAVQWDVDSGDPAFGLSGERMARSVLARVRPGSIILMHANGRGHHTATALTRIIPSLRAAGYGFVSITDLLAAGIPVTAETCFSERPGDTEVYDRKWRGWLKSHH